MTVYNSMIHSDLITHNKKYNVYVIRQKQSRSFKIENTIYNKTYSQASENL